MPQLHMPRQSGSDRILKAMRRSYRSERFLGILDRVRAKIPDAAISTDIIVGFPGETEEDFEDTMRVVEQARFASAFTFQYSIREGTPAATMADQVPKEVVQERYLRLTALQDEISLAENRAQLGRRVELLPIEPQVPGRARELVVDNGALRSLDALHMAAAEQMALRLAGAEIELVFVTRVEPQRDAAERLGIRTA